MAKTFMNAFCTIGDCDRCFGDCEHLCHDRKRWAAEDRLVDAAAGRYVPVGPDLEGEWLIDPDLVFPAAMADPDRPLADSCWRTPSEQTASYGTPVEQTYRRAWFVDRWARDLLSRVQEDEAGERRLWRRWLGLPEV